MKINKKLNLTFKDVVSTSEINEDYEKWLNEFIGNPSSSELNKMEKLLTLPKNNPNYHPPLLGA